MNVAGALASCGNHTVDGALGGAVTLVQPLHGYRFSLDAVLLARFAAETPVSAVLDLGCGCGVVGLCLLALGGAERLEGLDVQAEMVARAVDSAARSGMRGRARFRCGDFRADALGTFPLVVSNPPYRPPGSGRISPRRDVAVARHELHGTVQDVAAAAARALEAQGSFCAVYPAPRLDALLGSCAEVGLAPRVLRCVHPFPGQPARLALVRCVKGGRDGLEVRAPLVLHGPGPDKFSAEVATLLGAP